MKAVDVSTAEDGKSEEHIYSFISYKALLVIQAIFRSCLKQHLLLFLCPTFIFTPHQLRYYMDTLLCSC